MGIEIIVESFHPFNLMERGRGKFIICKKGAEGKALLGFYARERTFEVNRHRDVASFFSIPPGKVLGGGDIEMKFSSSEDTYSLLLYGYSFNFGALPEKVIGALKPALKSYLERFDYEKAERELYERKYEMERKVWRLEAEKIKRGNEELEERQEEAEELLARKCEGWLNRLRAWRRGVLVGEYMIRSDPQRFGILELRGRPLPEEPVYGFRPRMTAGKISLGFDLAVLREAEGLRKWESYLGRL